MLALWAAMALAGPPEGLNLDNVAVWEDAADRLLDGPVGCWDVVGVASWSYDVGRFGGSRGDAAFVGRLDRGVWRDIEVRSNGEMVRERKKEETLLYEDELRFVPLLGRLHPSLYPRGSDGDDPDAPYSVLREVLDELDGDVDYTYATWDDATAEVRLLRTIPLGNGSNAPEAELEVRFPGGGVVPSSMSVHFPEKFTHGAFPRRATVRDGHVEAVFAVVDGEAFPSAETYTADISVLGFDFEFAQTVRYTWTEACRAP